MGLKSKFSVIFDLVFEIENKITFIKEYSCLREIVKVYKVYFREREFVF